MKEKYIKPEINLNEFKSVDVLTVSGDIQGDDNDIPFGSWWKGD